MDQSNLVAIWAAAWPYIAAIVATASTLDASLPQPLPGSHWLIARKIISFLAINVGNASNGKQPDFVTWIVRIATPVLLAQGAGLRPVADTPTTAGPAPGPAASGGGAAAVVLLMVMCLGLGLSACASKPPATVLFETRAAYDASVLAPLVQYHSLPACPAAAGMVCKDTTVDAQLIKADADAKAALDAAEDAVRNHPGTNPTSLIADAQNAANAVAAILANHGIK